MTNTTKSTINWKSLTIDQLPLSEVKITCVVDSSILDQFKEKALSELQKNTEIPGFRKGKVPVQVLLQKVGEMSVLQEAAELIISDVYAKIIDEKKLDPIGRPNVQISKLAIGNDVEFTITTAIVPAVIVPEYTKIAAKEMKKPLEEVVVTDIELDTAIKEIFALYAPKNEDGTPAEKKAELTDEFVKSLGQFENVEDFKSKIKEGITKEKEEKRAEKQRLAILEAILAETKIELPKILIESELQKMIGQFEADVKSAGLTMKEYYERAKKTEEDIKKEWYEGAKKKASTQLLLNEIAKKENIHADEKEVHEYAHYILEQYKDADHDLVHIYAETMLTNKKVIEFLLVQK